MILSFIVCSIIISRVVVFMERFDNEHGEFQENLRLVKDFMGRRNLPMALQTKVKKYLEFQHRTYKSGSVNGYAFIEQLSPWLRLEVTEHLNSGIIIRHPFFKALPS